MSDGGDPGGDPDGPSADLPTPSLPDPDVRVDWRVSVHHAGRVVQWLTAALALPLGVALLTGRGILPFVVTGVVAAAVGWGLRRLGTRRHLGLREALLMVAVTWLLAALVGAVPYVVAGNGSVATPVNAFFESMSGFTTTGATVMADISVETHSRALLLWRQETQWLGGMGIVVLAVAVLPELSVGGMHLMSAEAPGPRTGKLTPRIAETARALWLVYLGITLLEVVALFGLHLVGLAPEMSLYNAVAHGFTTMATGGFSPEARSIEAFSAAVQWVIVPFMAAAGVNFALFYQALGGGDGRPLSFDADALLRDPEFRVYVGVLVGVSLAVAGLLFVGPPPTAAGPLTTLRHAVFQAVSIVTTTGYASVDFAAWGVPVQSLLLAAMFLGGSAGSTGSAVKIFRWLVVAKSLKRSLLTAAHPEAVEPVRVGGELLDERTVRDVHAFTLLYLAIFAVGSLVVLANGTVETGGAARTTALTLKTAASAVAATLGNVGPGFGPVGPMGTYLLFPASTKLLFVALMWLGRLEILTVLVLFTNAYWRV